MSITVSTLRTLFPAVVAGAALILNGCSDATTREDVADAREEVADEQEDVAEARDEAQEEMAEARKDAQEYTAGKPVADDDAAEARQDVAETRQEAAAEIADEKQDVAEAQAELKTEEQKLAATKAREAYVMDAEKHLADIEAKIGQMKEQADSAEGTDKDAINTRIEALQAQHDRAESALSELKDADLAHWQNHQRNVRVAIQELDTSMNNVR